MKWNWKSLQSTVVFFFPNPKPQNHHKQHIWITDLIPCSLSPNASHLSPPFFLAPPINSALLNPPPPTPDAAPSLHLFRSKKRRKDQNGGSSTAKCTKSAITCRHVNGSWFLVRIFLTSDVSSWENSSCVELASFLRNPLVPHLFSYLWFFIFYFCFVL